MWVFLQQRHKHGVPKVAGRSPKLPSLGETNDIEPILQPIILREVLADDVDLVVSVLEEAIEHVFLNVLAYPDGAEVDPWDLVTDHIHQVTHAEWETATVTWNENQITFKSRSHKVGYCISETENTC